MGTNTRWYGAIALGALIAVAAATGICTAGAARDREDRTTAVTRPAARFGAASPRATDEEAGTPACWAGVEELEAPGLSLAHFRDVVAPLLASGDPLVRAYLEERLTELVGADQGRALELLGWVKGAADEPLVALALAALEQSEAVQAPDVAAALLALGQDDAISSDRRALVIAALETQHRLSPAAAGDLAALAADPGSGDAGWMAARTLGRVMHEDFQRTGTVAPYLDRLVDIGQNAAAPNVRVAALEMPMVAEVLLDRRSARRQAAILTADPDPLVRELAAHNLSLAADKDRVLSVYARAFDAESDLCVRWALFRFAARAVGARALPVMARMAERDRRFGDLYQQFADIYASGVVDFERVWLSLPSDDPFACLAREEEDS